MSARWVGLLVVAGVLGGGCSPSCGDMCKKLERCDLLDGVARSECSSQCTLELSSTRDTDPTGETFKDFRAERACIGSSSCEEIASGKCADAALFPFTAEGEAP